MASRVNINRLRLAVVVSHPIQYFAPWYRAVAQLQALELKVFYCCDWGVKSYRDPGFGVDIKWDIPLLEGYDYEILPIAKSPERMTFWNIDNPSVAEALRNFDPNVVLVHGYASRTNWRVARWAKRSACPLMIYSDSNSRAKISTWKNVIKRAVVGYFYSHVDGAIYVGSSNYAYHARYGVPRQRLFPGTMPVNRSALLKAVPDIPGARRSIREQLHIPQDAFVVMHCGKLTKGKRPLDLVEAAHSLVNTIPIYALLVGEGPERAPIQEYCERNQANNLRLTGFVNQADIAKYYAASDILAVTSEAEAYSLVVSEAATFGLPVIVSDAVGCIGPNDTARPGENAFVYPCGNVERLKEILIHLSKDKATLQDAGAASLRIAEGQDVTVAARLLFDAVTKLRELGVRQ